MPLFGSKRHAEPVETRRSSGGLFHKNHPEPTYAEPAPRNSGLFHRNNTPPAGTAARTSTTRSSGMFGRRSSSSSREYVEKPARSGGLFGRKKAVAPAPRKAGVLSRHPEDHSITNARAHVAHAESKELEAKRAHAQAQTAVNTARQEAKNLEREAEAEARAAKYKKTQSKAISKRTRPLGSKLW